MKSNGNICSLSRGYFEIFFDKRQVKWYMDLNVYKSNDYRYDIQGVRAIGAILIIIYHIWVGKVSGGVDVFFVISGYFMAGVLIRSYLRNKKISFIKFWGDIILRIAPLAYTVLAVTMFFGYFLMPPHLWWSGLREVMTSAFQIENWFLILSGKSYLATGYPPSPLQQFWALSLQVQFYLLLPFIFYTGLLIYKLSNSYKYVIIYLIILTLSSFLFSVYYTNNLPSTAYYHTGTRLWEFLSGVMVFLLLPFIDISRKLAIILRWVGFVLLFIIGVIVPKELHFPGYVSLLPVLAATLIILSGKSHRTGILYNILTSKLMVYIGSISFSLYLWHWPILVFYQHYFEITPSQLNLLDGVYIVICAFILSILSKNLIESNFIKFKGQGSKVAYLVGIYFFTPVFIFSLYAYNEVAFKYKKEAFDYVQGNYYVGQQAFIQSSVEAPTLKRLATLNYDVSRSALGDCKAGIGNSEVKFCEFGDVSSTDYMILIGGSRAAHWEPLFSHIAEKNGLKLLVINKDACSLGHNAVSINHINYKSCEEWNENTFNFIKELKHPPKAIITKSSRERKADKEFTPKGYVEYINQLLDLGIPVIGIRNNPVYSKQPNECLWRNPSNPEICAADYRDTLAVQNPANSIEINQSKSKFYPVDLTDVLCKDFKCPAVFQGYPTMRDRTHFTYSYIQYMSVALSESVYAQTEGLFVNDDN